MTKLQPDIAKSEQPSLQGAMSNTKANPPEPWAVNQSFLLIRQPTLRAKALNCQSVAATTECAA
jgi:hypothetical protein